MTQAASTGYDFFIGTDISKNKLDHAVFKGKTLLFHRVTKNEKEDILEFIQMVKKIRNFAMYRAVFIMENTGFYGNHLLETLYGIKANIVLEDAVHIKNSLGIVKGKNDKIDAIRIAEFGYKYRDELSLWEPKRQIMVELSNLSTLRTRLIGIEKMIGDPLKEQALFVKQGIARQTSKLCAESISSISKDLIKVERSISELIASDPLLARKMSQILSVPCVGPVTTLQILICTNEFRYIRCPKKFASYADVAPFTHQSGLSPSKSQVSSIANKKMKTLLHMCAVSAVSKDTEFTEYFKRKTISEGKHKMKVLNAIRNKLVLRIFSYVLQDRYYDIEYKRPDNESLFEMPTEVIRY